MGFISTERINAQFHSDIVVSDETCHTHPDCENEDMDIWINQNGFAEIPEHILKSPAPPGTLCPKCRSALDANGFCTNEDCDYEYRNGSSTGTEIPAEDGISLLIALSICYGFYLRRRSLRSKC